MNKTEPIVIVSLDKYISDVSLQHGTSFHSRTTNYKPIYRGQANLCWPIEPAVYRNGRFHNESNYIRELDRLEPEEFQSLSRIEKLVKMQHYGIPTRLLDFTYNSLVALYFACCSEPESDGIVYEVHAFPLYHQGFVWISIVMKFLFEFGNLPLNVDVLIDELKCDVGSYPPRGVEPFYNEQEIKKILTSPIGIYPRFSNKRIKSQDGVFIIAGMNIKEQGYDGIQFEKQSYSDISQLWPESRAIIIPSKAKGIIVQDLERIGIHKRKLFPELDSQASYVTEYFDHMI